MLQIMGHVVERLKIWIGDGTNLGNRGQIFVVLTSSNARASKSMGLTRW